MIREGNLAGNKGNKAIGFIRHIAITHPLRITEQRNGTVRTVK